MSAVTKPRGPLPARVYWARRLVVLAMALGLVAGGSRVLGTTAGGSPEPSARQAAAQPAPAAPPPVTLTAKPGPTPDEREEGRGETPRSDPDRASGTTDDDDAGGSEPEPTPLAVPTSSCADGDIEVTPSVEGDAYARRGVVLTLNLTTVESPACTWTISPDSVVVRLSSGDVSVWTTQDCQDAVPERAVVLRNDEAAEVELTWSGLLSDEDCTRSTPWAEPGWYHATAAAYGGDPTDIAFELAAEPKQPAKKPDEKQDEKQDEPREEKRDKKRDKKPDKTQDRGPDNGGRSD